MKNPCVSISNLYLSIDIILFRSHIGATTAPNFFDVLNHFWSLFLIICWFNPHLWCLTSCGDETHTSGHIFPSQPVTGILSAVSLVTRLLFPIRQEPRGYKDFPNHMRFFVAIDLAKWYIYMYIYIYWTRTWILIPHPVFNLQSGKFEPYPYAISLTFQICMAMRNDQIGMPLVGPLVAFDSSHDHLFVG